MGHRKAAWVSAKYSGGPRFNYRNDRRHNDHGKRKTLRDHRKGR